MSLDGTAHGFKRGEYGDLDGALPSEFFATSGDRQISELTESVVDGRVVWRVAVPGARASSWSADLDVVWETIHDDLVDTRRFVVEDFGHDRGVALSMRPPLPPGQRDWQSRVGQEVTIIMSVVSAAVPSTPSPSNVTVPDADAMSFQGWLQCGSCDIPGELDPVVSRRPRQFAASHVRVFQRTR